MAELSGRSRLIRSYLARNVVAALDPVRRDFLLQTCTLGVLTGDICDALLDIGEQRRGSWPSSSRSSSSPLRPTGV